MISRITLILLIFTIATTSGCAVLARLGTPKYRQFPKGTPQSHLRGYVPATARLFREKYGHRMTLRRINVASSRWTLVRHRRSGRILRRVAKVWIGWERSNRPGDCKVAQYWIIQRRLGPSRWTPLELGRQVYGRSRYIGGIIPCPKLASPRQQQPEGAQTRR